MDCLDTASAAGIRLGLDDNRPTAFLACPDGFRLGFTDVVGIIENAAVTGMERPVWISTAAQGFLALPGFQRIVLQLFQVAGDVL